MSSLLAAEQVPTEFTVRVHRRTESVPLAVEETMRLLADRVDLARHDGGWVPRHLAEIAVPPTIRDAVLERVSRLSGCARTVLCTAAVLGEAAGEALLASVSALPAPQASRGLIEAERSGLLADRDASVALLTTVYHGFSGLGATGDAARVARRLREQQGPPSRTGQGGRRGYGSQLSPRELDVARLLVAGGTNREIGQQLFLSPKTVARHLDSAMRKLGVNSRTALAVKLVDDGLVSRGVSQLVTLTGRSSPVTGMAACDAVYRGGAGVIGTCKLGVAPRSTGMAVTSSPTVIMMVVL